MKPVQVWDVYFPSGNGIPFLQTNVRAEELANCFGFALQRWVEDGLGPAVGFEFVHAGHLFLVRELAHFLEHLGGEGVDIQADYGDLRKHGIERMADQALSALGLNSSQHVTWIAEGLPDL